MNTKERCDLVRAMEMHVRWDLLEAAGWYECGNSRLLYMTMLDT